MAELSIREIQLSCFDVMKAFDAFCRENHLTYFLSGGTLLGYPADANGTIQPGAPGPITNPTAGIALGDKEVRPVDMASAFATFAADGMRREPYLVSKVTAADGRVAFLTRLGEGLVPGPDTVYQEGDLVHVVMRHDDGPRVESVFAKAPPKESE